MRHFLVLARRPARTFNEPLDGRPDHRQGGTTDLITKETDEGLVGMISES
jgi:hypothetical protein